MPTMQLERKSVPVSITRLDDKAGTFEALVNTSEVVDQGGDIVRHGAWSDSLTKRLPKVVWAHNWNTPVGKVLVAHEIPPNDRRLPASLLAIGAGALYVKGRFNLQTTAGRDAYETVRFWAEDDGSGTTAEWSVGYDCTGPEGKAWKQKDTGFRVIEKAALLEISPVLWGMSPLTTTLAIKSLIDTGQLDPDGKYTPAEFRQLIEAKQSSANPGQDEEDQSGGSTTGEYSDASGDDPSQGSDGSGAVDGSGASGGGSDTSSSGGSDGSSDGSDDGSDPNQDEQDNTKALRLLRQVLGLVEGKDWTEFDASRPTTGRAPAQGKPNSKDPGGKDPQNAKPPAPPAPKADRDAGAGGRRRAASPSGPKSCSTRSGRRTVPGSSRATSGRSGSSRAPISATPGTRRWAASRRSVSGVSAGCRPRTTATGTTTATSTTPKRCGRCWRRRAARPGAGGVRPASWATCASGSTTTLDRARRERADPVGPGGVRRFSDDGADRINPDEDTDTHPPQGLAPEDANLHRGIPDEDGRHDQSAMKTAQSTQTKRDFDPGVGAEPTATSWMRASSCSAMSAPSRLSSRKMWATRCRTGVITREAFV